MRERLEAEEQELDQVPYYSNMNCHYEKHTRGPSFNCLKYVFIIMKLA